MPTQAFLPAENLQPEPGDFAPQPQMPSRPPAGAFPGRPVESKGVGARAFLSQDIEINGSIRFVNELVVDGKVEGEITSDGVLTVGENAVIRGEIKARSVTVLGTVHGNITVSERCELRSRAHLTGDIKAARLVIEDGATFIGASEVNFGKKAAS